MVTRVVVAAIMIIGVPPALPVILSVPGIWLGAGIWS
jgi:hypothetical protein